MRINRREALGLIGSSGLATLTAGCLGEEGGEEDFPSEAIEFEVHHPPGGGTDRYMRTLAPALSSAFGVDVIPLNKTPAEQHIPVLYNRRDEGYSITQINPTIHAYRIVEEGPDTPFNPANWNILPAPNVSSLIFVASTQTDLASWDDLVNRSEGGEGFTAAAIGQGLGMYYEIISDETVVDLEIITGYEGTGPILGDLERGDVDFFIGPASSLFPFAADEIITPILTGNREIFDDFLIDRYADAGFEGIAETTYSDAGLEDLGVLVQSIRSMLAPPGVPEDRVEVLRDGVLSAINGDEFQDQASENDLPVTPIDSDEHSELLEEKENILTSL